MHRTSVRRPAIAPFLLVAALLAASPPVRAQDADQDGLPDAQDSCPTLAYVPVFDWADCAPMDFDPGNDPQPECRARERVADALLHSGQFATHIAFAVVKDGAIHFADAFSYLGGGAWEHDPEGVRRLYRIGSTSKAVTAAAAVRLAEEGALSLDEGVGDDDGGLDPGSPVTLRDLLSHRGAFGWDAGGLYLFCYPGDIVAFWNEPDDLVSPHYDSTPWGNLGGGFDYSAFNLCLAGAHLVQRTGSSFADLVQSRIFDPMGMCTASFDGARAAQSPIGGDPGTSQTSLMHVGPAINETAPLDERCADNFTSSEDLPGDPYTWQSYHLDEAAAEARDPAGGVIASVLDMALFARDLLASYDGSGGVLSQSAVRELWEAEIAVDGHSCCPMQDYYGLGFLTSALPGEPVEEVEHGGARAGFRSGFVIRPEAGLAVSVLVNAGIGAATSELAHQILDEFAVEPAPCDPVADLGIRLAGASVELSWSAVPGAAGYTVLAAAGGDFGGAQAIPAGAGTRIVLPRGSGLTLYRVVADCP